MMEHQQDRLSRSAEDYLEAIGRLCEEHGHAHVASIAELLKVKKPSVTAAMRQLAAQGYIEYFQYSPIQLTAKGTEYAQKVMNAHKTLYQFLIDAAGLSPERADEAACQIEHILSYEEIDSLGQHYYRQHVEQNPH